MKRSFVGPTKRRTGTDSAFFGGAHISHPQKTLRIAGFSDIREGMLNREEVVEVVTRNLVDTIEELEGVEIDTSKSMKDLGANSLDIVEVVSCSMRELKVKIPRSELNRLTNIDELVDLLIKTSEASA